MNLPDVTLTTAKFSLKKINANRYELFCDAQLVDTVSSQLAATLRAEALDNARLARMVDECRMCRMDATTEVAESLGDSLVMEFATAADCADWYVRARAYVIAEAGFDPSVEI